MPATTTPRPRCVACGAAPAPAAAAVTAAADGAAVQRRSVGHAHRVVSRALPAVFLCDILRKVSNAQRQQQPTLRGPLHLHVRVPQVYNP
jgi:hypothetical protein